jgi:hypothetical protein
MKQAAKGKRAGRKATAKTPHQNDEQARSEAGNAGKPQTATRQAAGRPSVTSGSRTTHGRTRGSPSPQTQRAWTPKESIGHIAALTNMAQSDVISVLHATGDVAGDQVAKHGTFTIPEIGIRLKRAPMPQTGRAEEAKQTQEGRYELTAHPLKRLRVSAHATQ